MTAHIHAKAMLLYAKDSGQTKRPWLKWQKLEEDSTDWVGLDGHPLWHEKTQYRHKPQDATINGFALEDTRISHLMQIGDTYYVESASEKDYFEEVTFDGSLWDDRVIARGIAHSTSLGAAAFCRARLGLSATE